MPQTTLHLSCFEGGDALSVARARALLERLQALEPSLQGLHARHVHWVATPESPDAGLRQRLAALLDSAPAAASAGPAAGELILVMPRLGTVSPWASKAGDIARNCALPVRRQCGREAGVEREELSALSPGAAGARVPLKYLLSTPRVPSSALEYLRVPLECPGVPRRFSSPLPQSPVCGTVANANICPAAAANATRRSSFCPL
jgi:hypothetical protein